MKFIKKDIEDLLKKKRYYPLTTPLWHSFRFKQIKPNNDQERRVNLQIVKSNVQNRKGIYIYVNTEGEVLYIGKGSPLKSRIESHYNKLVKVNPDKRDIYFQNNQGIMEIFWLEIEEEEEREIVEHLLSYLLKPKYKKWRAI